ncbi:hypothetical protein Lepto7375DRAFT_7365 [Leptolyngbya sp. PCC 7375]|nr:hypothetical protein Lepto7375DRAFT_7365 [Leptolyngbya sp. PCC 7375]
MVKTLWVQAIQLVGSDVAKAYFELCAQRGVKPDPVELVGSYTGFAVEVDANGVATVKHQFDI